MTKKNKLLKVCSFIVVAFVLLLSVFAFIPQKENNVNCASAASDIVYDSYRFTGSNVMFYGIMSGLSNYNNSNVCVFSNIQISLYTDYNGGSDNYTYFYINNQRFSYEQSSNIFPNYQSRLYYGRISDGDNIGYVGEITSDNWTYENLISANFPYKQLYCLLDSGTTTRAMLVGVSLSDIGFNSNIYRAQIGLRDISLVLPSSSMSISHRIFYIRYYDVNNNYIDFEFYTPSNYQFATRTYLFSNGLSDNQIYNEGYNAGLTANQDNIYSQGFDAGKIDGYNQGFDAGVGSANDYTFSGLFGAVIDAPLTAFTSLLNFEIFGFNILGFITGLLTLVIIIYIVKICVGGK